MLSTVREGGRPRGQHACAVASTHAPCPCGAPDALVSFRVSCRWRRGHLPPQGKAQCLFPSLHSDKRLKSLGSPGSPLHEEKGPTRGPGGTGPGPRLFFLDSGILSSVGSRRSETALLCVKASSRPASAAAPFQGEASQPGQGGTAGRGLLGKRRHLWRPDAAG